MSCSVDFVLFLGHTRSSRPYHPLQFFSRSSDFSRIFSERCGKVDIFLFYFICIFLNVQIFQLKLDTFSIQVSFVS